VLARPMPAADLVAWLTVGPSAELWPALHNA
jgi:hypothetical protein